MEKMSWILKGMLEELKEDVSWARIGDKFW